MKKIALHASQIRANLGKTPVLHDLSLTVEAGRWTCLVGPNGAGKSTLLKVLAQLLPFEGQVSLLGQPMAALHPRQRAQQLAWLGQNVGAGEAQADDLCAYDVALLGRLPHQRWLAGPSAADHAAVAQALRVTGAWDWRARRLGQLSGGERQRVLLARALAVQAEVYLMDEPITNLDPPHQSDWLRLVRDLVAQGKTVVSVLHELTLALQADTVVVLAQGAVQHQGTPGEAALHQAIESVFEHKISVLPLSGQWVALPKM